MDVTKLYPLQQGRTLLYRKTDPELPNGSADVRRVCEKVMEKGPARTALVSEKADGSAGLKFRVTVSPGGIVEWDRRILKSPFAKGSTWNDGPDRFVLASLKTSVTVPAGTYRNCIKITWHNEDIGGGEVLLSPGVGMVSSEQYGERGPWKYELLAEGSGARKAAAARKPAGRKPARRGGTGKTGR